MAQRNHWLNTRWWMLTVAEWIGLFLALCGIICPTLYDGVTQSTSDPVRSHAFLMNTNTPTGLSAMKEAINSFSGISFTSDYGLEGTTIFDWRWAVPPSWP